MAFQLYPCHKYRANNITNKHCRCWSKLAVYTCTNICIGLQRHAENTSRTEERPEENPTYWRVSG